MWNLEVKAKAMHRWSGLSFCIVCFSQVNSDATQEGATRFDLTEVEAQPEFAVEAMPTCNTDSFKVGYRADRRALRGDAVSA